MTVALASDVAAYLEEQVRAGVGPDANTLVNDVLRSLSEHQVRRFAVSPDLEAWLLQAAESPVTPLTPQDFSDIRQRVRSRLVAQVV